MSPDSRRGRGKQWRSDHESRMEWSARWCGDSERACEDHERRQEWQEPAWESWDRCDPHADWQVEWQADWDSSQNRTWEQHQGGGHQGKGESRKSWYGGGRGRGKGGKGNWSDGTGDCSGGAGTSRIHVANLPRDTTEDTLRSMFQPYGKLLGVKILSTRGSGVSSAIIRFGTSIAAEASISSLHGKHDVRTGVGALEVKLARPNPKWEA